MAIHGNKSQTARTKALADFKSGDLQVLVATDIAARGIDIDQLPHVVNFEMPNVPEDYVHRIGRTGRAGSPGEAISLVCVDENGFLRDIERLIKREIPKEIIPGFAPPTRRAARADRARPHGDRRRRRPRRRPAAIATGAGRGGGDARSRNAAARSARGSGGGNGARQRAAQSRRAAAARGARSGGAAPRRDDGRSAGARASLDRAQALSATPAIRRMDMVRPAATARRGARSPARPA